MFGRVPGTRPNISESHSEISTRVPFCIATSCGSPRGPQANVNTPALADPSLNGVTVEFEHCAGDQNPHAEAEESAKEAPEALNDICTETLLGQKALTDLSGVSPLPPTTAPCTAAGETKGSARNVCRCA